jgi:hypothetical protein
MEGFAKSLISLMNSDIGVPDYSTLSMKINKMHIKLQPVYKDNCSHVMSLDSTGQRFTVKENGTVRSIAKEIVGTWFKCT